MDGLVAAFDGTGQDRFNEDALVKYRTNSHAPIGGPALSVRVLQDNFKNNLSRFLVRMLSRIGMRGLSSVVVAAFEASATLFFRHV